MESYNVTWNNIEVGSISQLQRDMWYLDGKWETSGIPESEKFEVTLKDLDPKIIIKAPEKALKIILSEKDAPENKMHCLAYFLENGTLSIRQLVEKKAIQLFFPDYK
jgi:hypothetical protein